MLYIGEAIHSNAEGQAHIMEQASPPYIKLRKFTLQHSCTCESIYGGTLRFEYIYGS